jgi:hypothetical protein
MWASHQRSLLFLRYTDLKLQDEEIGSIVTFDWDAHSRKQFAYFRSHL